MRVNAPLVALSLSLTVGLYVQLRRDGTWGGTATAAAVTPVPRAAQAPPPGPPASRAARLLWLDDPATFPPLPPPGPSDWLANHREDAQSFEDYLEEPRREVTAERRTVRLQPLEDVGAWGVDLGVLAEHVRHTYGLDVEVAPVARPERLRERVNDGTGRRQVLAPDVMRWLQGELRGDLVCVLALTTEDLYPEPSWNFVFGLASLHRGVGVFSFARMDPAFPEPPPAPSSRSADARALVLRRCLKVVTHEVGHMLALAHCTERLCLMNGSNHAAEMDRAPLHLCPTCLRKAQHATGFDVERRYADLAAWYREHGLEAEAAWVEGVIARVER
jgi:archaemetzincin